MLRAGETWRAFERSDEEAVYGGLGYGEALERCERLGGTPVSSIPSWGAPSVRIWLPLSRLPGR